jgi:hypothetical protein
MSRRTDRKQLVARQEVVAAPALPQPRACTDHSFELPPALHLATGAMFLGFVTVLSLAFSHHMLVSYGVIAAFIAAFFAVPAIFVRSAPEASRALRWHEFLDKGIDTATGRTGAGEATVLVLVLPFLILCFGFAVVAIAALV